MAWRFFIVLLGHWANYLYFLFVKAKVSAMFYRKWELIPTNKKILTYIAEKQRHWTQSISRGFSNETFAQNNKEKSTVLSTLQCMILSIPLSLHFLFISERWRWEGFTFFASLWPLPQLAPTTNTKVVNIYQYFPIFLRIFSFIVTIIFRCNGKIQKVARETWRKSPNQVIWWLLFLIFGQN